MLKQKTVNFEKDFARIFSPNSFEKKNTKNGLAVDANDVIYTSFWFVEVRQQTEKKKKLHEAPNLWAEHINL